MDADDAALSPPPGDLAGTRSTRVVLAAAHVEHDPAHNNLRNLKSLCQRCHMLHDRPHHLAQRQVIYRLRLAIETGPFSRGVDFADRPVRVPMPCRVASKLHGLRIVRESMVSTAPTVDLADRIVDSADQWSIRVNDLCKSSRGLCRLIKYKNL